MNPTAAKIIFILLLLCPASAQTDLITEGSLVWKILRPDGKTLTLTAALSPPWSLSRCRTQTTISTVHLDSDRTDFTCARSPERRKAKVGGIARTV